MEVDFGKWDSDLKDKYIRWDFHMFHQIHHTANNTLADHN